jgi:hypothetical protein
MAHQTLPEASAATFIGVSPRTLQKWRVVGGGPLFIKIGRCVRYAVQDLEIFLAQHRRRSTSDQGANSTVNGSGMLRGVE